MTPTTEEKALMPLEAITSIVETAGLEKETSATIKEKFLVFAEKVAEMKEKAMAIVVTDESQTDLMKNAREARLIFKDLRVAADKTKKALKEDSLKYAKAVQEVYNMIEGTITPIEEHLERQEKYLEIKEAERKAILNTERRNLLAEYPTYAIPTTMDLGALDADTFDAMLAGVKAKHEAAIAAKQKEEEDRRKAEEEAATKAAQEAEERNKRIAEQEAENKRLKAIADQQAKDLAEARKKAEEAEAERKKSEQAVEKLKEIAKKAQPELEVKSVKLSEADRQMLIDLAKKIGQLQKSIFPEVKSAAAKKVLENTAVLLAKTEDYIIKTTINLKSN
jgi:hypothetical protein